MPRLPPPRGTADPLAQQLANTRVLLSDACGASSAILLCTSLFPQPSDLPSRSTRSFRALPSLAARAAYWCRAQRGGCELVLCCWS